MLRFNELSSTPKNLRLLKEEVREGFYIYFVIYRSPSIPNRKEGKKESYNDPSSSYGISLFGLLKDSKILLDFD